MALRNPETIVRLTNKIQGNLTNLKLLVKTQQPVEDYIRKVEDTENVLRDLETQLESVMSNVSYKAEDVITTLERKLSELKEKNKHLQKNTVEDLEDKFNQTV